MVEGISQGFAVQDELRREGLFCSIVVADDDEQALFCVRIGRGVDEKCVNAKLREIVIGAKPPGVTEKAGWHKGEHGIDL